MKLPFFLAQRFVAAETPEGTLPIARNLCSKGLHVTLDLLGEYVSDRSLVDEALKSYLQLIQMLDASSNSENNSEVSLSVGIDKNISIKLSMLGQKIDESLCHDNLIKLLEAAKSTNTFVRLDMEGSDVTESTVSLFERVFPLYSENVGIVLQAYMRRTKEDVERMCELQARVRICKGAYKEPVGIAWQRMSDIRDRYQEYMETLITRGNYPGIATHDDILIDATKKFVSTNNISSDKFEFQMLFGMRSETQLEMVRDGYNTRIYIPFGSQWVPYFSRRLRERKENVFFVLKHLVRR